MSQKPIDQLRPLARSHQFLRRHLRCVTVVLLAASAAPAIEARAQDVVPLVCGEFVDRPLEPGATDRVRPVGVGDAATLFEITDSSQRIGALKLVDSGTGIETCGGTLSSPAGELPPRIISISDCLGSDKGRYTAGFHVVSEGEANCGQPLTCGGTPTAGLLEHIGETDAYQISVGETANVEIAASAPSAGTIDIRLRLYSPEGEFLEESCNGALATELPDAGTYTLLVSDCTSRAKGAYSVQWQQAPSCPTQPSANDTVYVLNSESGSVALVDPLAKQVTTVIPVTPGGTLDSFLQFAVSPNRAFTYVSFPETGTVSVIDNERKRTAGFLRLPEGTDAFHRNVAIHPLDGSIYAMSESVGGVVIFDPASRRVSSSFPIVDIHPEGGIAFHPNGTILFVATVACGSKPQACTPGIAVVDVESRSVVSTVVGLGERTE